VVVGDEQRVVQLLLNLHKNAIKFTKEGAVDVQTEVISQEGAKFLRVAVQDSGVGISEEM